MLAKGEFQNIFGPDNAWAAKAAAAVDARKVDAYYAMSGFGALKKRTQANVLWVRSFWVDLDTQEGKPKARYADRKEALTALMTTVATMGLPKPYVVSSGYGLHAYWPCDADIPAAQWTETATRFKQALKVLGLDADPSRTADSASVLRPIETSNHKHGTTKPVKLLMVGEITTHAAFAAIIAKYTPDDAADLPPPPAHVAKTSNSDLMTPVNKVPSDAIKIADSCAVIDLMRTTRGDVDQPTWFHSLGVLAFTEQGEEICHEWSDGHPRYSERETSLKVAQSLKYAPTSCAKLSEFQPALCEACPHFGKIKSPIVLGTPRGNPTPPKPKTEAERVVVVEDMEGDFPAGYGWGPLDEKDDKKAGVTKVLYYIKSHQDETGNWIIERQTLAEVLFRPANRVKSVVDAYSMNMYMRDKTGHERTFVLQNSLIAEGGSPLHGELGRREVSVDMGNRANLVGYLNAWIGKLRDDYAATPSIEQYGWHSDGFVVGPRYYTPQHEASAVLVSSAQSYGKYMSKAGDLQTWIDCVDQAYNRPGDEALQFCVLVSFAAPLYSLFGDNGGVTVYAHSVGSGYGKTTAQQVGLSAWGYYPELLLRENNFTEGALYQHMGVMKNLPIVIDEMTNCANEFASKLVYNMSAGKGKSRMNSDATMKKSLNWSTIAAASGNKLLSEKLSVHRANAEAEMARVWEFTVKRKGTMTPNEAAKIFNQFSSNYGLAGEQFIKYVVENRDAVTSLLLRTREQFNTRASITQSERYWSALHACVLTSLSICNQLGILKFDMKGMVRWILDELAEQRGQIVSSVTDPLDQFGNMLADIWSGVLVTVGEGNTRTNTYATVLRPEPHGLITGRSILPDVGCAEKLYINTASARDWCNKKNASFKEMFDALVVAGIADPAVKRIALGKGTEQYSGLGGPVKCWDINPSAMRAKLGNSALSSKITAVHQGGAGIDIRSKGSNIQP